MCRIRRGVTVRITRDRIRHTPRAEWRGIALHRLARTLRALYVQPTKHRWTTTSVEHVTADDIHKLAGALVVAPDVVTGRVPSSSGGSRWRPFRTSARPAWILAAGWIAFLLISFPGLLTRDSVDQLIEARSGYFTDSHPPFMSFVWRMAELVVVGPLGMLVLQTGLLLAGLYLTLVRVVRPLPAALWAVAVMWFPPVAAPMVVIWKDSLMAGAAMLGFALLLDERRRCQLGGLALLGVACAVRYNAPALALPIIVGLFQWQPRCRPLRRYSTALAAWAAVVGASMGCNKLLTDREMHFWTGSAALMDIAGTLCFDSRPFTDEELRQLFAGTDLRVEHDIETTMCKLFATGTHARLIHPDIGMWSPSVGSEPVPAARREAIERAWLDVVTGRPIAYLKYRLAVAGRVLGITGALWGMTTPRVPRVFIYSPQRIAELKLDAGAAPIQLAWTSAVTWLATSTPLFQPWLYLLVALVALIAIRRREVTVLITSGIVMEGSVFVAATTPDYRYSHWMIATTVAALVFAALARHRGPKTTIEVGAGSS